MIGRITTAGVATLYRTGLPDGFLTLRNIVVGPDGNMWFTIDIGSGGGVRLGRITTAGQITHYPLPAGASVDSLLGSSLIPGPGNDLLLLDGQGIDVFDTSTNLSARAPVTGAPQGAALVGADVFATVKRAIATDKDMIFKIPGSSLPTPDAPLRL